MLMNNQEDNDKIYKYADYLKEKKQHRVNKYFISITARRKAFTRVRFPGLPHNRTQNTNRNILIYNSLLEDLIIVY